MNIRNRLIVLFVSIVALILLATSIAVYYFSANNRKEEFYKRLANKATINARLLIEVDEVTVDVLKRIEKDNPMNLPNEELKIYDYQNKILFSSDAENFVKVDTALLDHVRLEKDVRFNRGPYECLGILYSDRYGHFVVIVGAIDINGNQKLANLRTILFIVFGVAILIIMLAGYLYVGRALDPISDVIREVDEISATNLHRRLDDGNGKDEFAKLAGTFNNMLGRLDQAFRTQKTFIANASHEIRNPLASILGQIEVTLMNDRSKAEYRDVLISLREDITSLNGVSNRLLLLAQASSEDVATKFTRIRVDELLWDCKAELQRAHPDCTVTIIMDASIDDDLKLNMLGDEQLLKGAISNILDNACKYSNDHAVTVKLQSSAATLVLEFQDKGIGIPADEIANLFDPFYRGRNTTTFKGSGIGLSLAYHVIKSHRGEISISSHLNAGTVVKVVLPTVDLS